jgi:hypothetical protein
MKNVPVTQIAAFRGWFAEQKLMLSSIFSRPQIYHYQQYDSAHSLLYLESLI